MSAPRIVHQGRGGYIEIAGRQYAIEHVAEGRFAIHVPARTPAADRAALEQLVAEDPAKWALDRKSQLCWDAQRRRRAARR